MLQASLSWGGASAEGAWGFRAERPGPQHLCGGCLPHSGLPKFPRTKRAPRGSLGLELLEFVFFFPLDVTPFRSRLIYLWSPDEAHLLCLWLLSSGAPRGTPSQEPCPQGHAPEALVVQCTQPVHPHLPKILSPKNIPSPALSYRSCPKCLLIALPSPHHPFSQ